MRWESSPEGHRLEHVKQSIVQQGIASTDDVELAIRRAQFWVLNPSHKLEDIRNMSEEQLNKDQDDSQPISKNAVCVDVSGPDVSDVTLVDLPGTLLCLIFNSGHSPHIRL